MPSSGTTPTAGTGRFSLSDAADDKSDLLLKSNRWRVREGNPLRVQCWDDGAVVYCTATSRTHLVIPEAGRILMALQERPASLSELSERVLGIADPPEDFCADLNELVLSLAAVGLVEPHPN